MEGPALTAQHTTGLSDVRKILWAARIDAVCDHWHLQKRAMPAIEAAYGDTGESRLRRAADHAATAGEYFEAARDALGKAVALVESFLPEEKAQDSQTT
jgi:hypothetical protein